MGRQRAGTQVVAQVALGEPGSLRLPSGPAAVCLRGLHRMAVPRKDVHPALACGGLSMPP